MNVTFKTLFKFLILLPIANIEKIKGRYQSGKVERLLLSEAEREDLTGDEPGR